MADGLLEAVRGLRLANPELGPKPLLATLRGQQPDLGSKEVREALLALKAESEATEAAAAAPPGAAAAAPPATGGSGALPPRRRRRASLASAAAGCRQRWATAG